MHMYIILSLFDCHHFRNTALVKRYMVLFPFLLFWIISRSRERINNFLSLPNSEYLCT